MLISAFAADGATFTQIFLLKGDTAAAYACKLLDLLLALTVSAPHCFYKAALVLFDNRLKLLETVGLEAVLITVFKRFVIEVICMSARTFCTSPSRLFRPSFIFLSVSLLARTQAFSSMSRGPISSLRGTPIISTRKISIRDCCRIVALNSYIGLFKPLFKLCCLFYSAFVGGYRHYDELMRSYVGR